ncbi:hypothetical protein CAPI_03655 [Corynebacterium capitovis DSM 44611]|uniref:hypothetical protein n=1 Tax=Corynebacterium capitovis TaxID=131081 RepID=UPI00037418CC|nr:hypothetical protein [Corynebacterium capitovis]WKD57290.1 hypothetical protein CAPI_03655 [Corynebacterium capitovis DSM 44611]
MQERFTESDYEALSTYLGALVSSGASLNDGVEVDDVEDELSDNLAQFRCSPLAALATVRDPDGRAMVRGVSAGVLASAAFAARGVGVEECIDFPDPDSPGFGSIRLRLGAWDVIDIGYEPGGEWTTRLVHHEGLEPPTYWV